MVSKSHIKAYLREMKNKVLEDLSRESLNI